MKNSYQTGQMLKSFEVNAAKQGEATLASEYKIRNASYRKIKATKDYLPTKRQSNAA